MFIVILFVLSLFFFLAGISGMRKRKRFREEYNMPSKASIFNYLGGHPTLSPGIVYAWNTADTMKIVPLRKGDKIEIPHDRILGIDLASDIQTVNTGGGRSITGAVVGGVTFGLAGAIVGGQKRTKLETFDRSTVLVRVKAQNDMDINLMFKGGQKVYNQLIRTIGVRI